MALETVSWVQIPALSLPSCVALGLSFYSLTLAAPGLEGKEGKTSGSLRALPTEMVYASEIPKAAECPRSAMTFMLTLSLSFFP